MESQANEAETLLQLLEDVRQLLASSVRFDAATPQKPSWDDVLPKTWSAKPPTTAARGIRGGSRLSDQYTRALRALRHSSN